MGNNLQLLNNTEHRVKFKTGSDINNALIPSYSVETDGVSNDIAIGFDPSFGNLIGDGNRLGITGTSHTLCFWMKIKGAIPDGHPFFYNSKIQIRTRTDGFRFYTPGINKHHIHTIIADTWYFLALSCDGTNHTSYIKSVSDDLSATVTGNSFTPTGYNTWGPKCNANYDEIATFNSALSAAEIDTIYNEGISLDAFPTLAGYWKMGDSEKGAGITVKDEMGGEDAHLRFGSQFSNDTAPTSVSVLKNPLVGELFLETSKQDDISFDGQSKIDTDYKFGGGEISLSAWVKTTNNKDFIIATDSPSGGNDTSFAIGFDDSKAYVLIGNPGQEIYKTGSVTAINDGNWHNIIVTIDGSKVMNFYIDGLLETTHTFTILPGASDYVTHYGSGWSDGTEPLYDIWGLDGQLNGLGIWERVLNSTEINKISSSDRYSTTAYDFSPDLWVGSTDPALYACTDTSGTISKVTDLTVKMGDVPMLKLNEQQLVDSGNFITSPDFAYSFWFYDDGIGTGNHFLLAHSTAPNNSIQVLHDSSQLELQSHGDFDNTCDPTNHGSNCAHFLDSSIATSNSINLLLNYEKYKLNHLLVVKKGGTIAPAHNTGSCWVYLNGKLVASIIEAGYHTYPSGYSFKKFNHTNAASEIMIGDVAYWNQDVTSVVNEILDPIGGHKGHQGNLMDISIKPIHYWKFGSPMEDGKVKDIGTNGTNHFTPDTVASNQHEYKNIFGIQNS